MKFNFLLNQIKSIIDLYEKHAELSGEKFNIFSIMGMESDEVRTHSAILGELLNPKGNHSLGSKPLELFVKQIFGDNDEFKLDYDSSTCLKELHIGRINEDKTEGGRIDLIVKDNTGVKLVIENKIYAPEQKNQLARYNKYSDTRILYLTLDGKDSNEEVEFEYGRISYEYHILNWIEACAKEAFDKPMVREVLNQYAFLIRKLTNQSTNQEMSEKIAQIITENYQESLEIYNNFEKARINIVSDIFKDLNNKKITIEDGSVWNLKINAKIWDIKNHKTILISKENEDNSKIFFFISYRYSSPKLSKGIVPKSEALEEIKKTGISLKKYNTITSEIMNIVGRNDLVLFVSEFKNGDKTFIETLLEEIKKYIEENKIYFNELKAKI